MCQDVYIEIINWPGHKRLYQDNIAKVFCCYIYLHSIDLYDKHMVSRQTFSLFMSLFLFLNIDDFVYNISSWT